MSETERDGQTHYNLSISTSSYLTLKALADEERTTVAELLRKATRLYVYIRSKKKNDPDARLLVESKGNTETIVIELI